MVDGSIGPCTDRASLDLADAALWLWWPVWLGCTCVCTPGDLLMSDVRYVVLDEADTLLCDNFVDDVKELMVPLRVRDVTRPRTAPHHNTTPRTSQPHSGPPYCSRPT